MWLPKVLPSVVHKAVYQRVLKSGYQDQAEKTGNAILLASGFSNQKENDDDDSNAD
jgi:hypothetical protein